MQDSTHKDVKRAFEILQYPNVMDNYPNNMRGVMCMCIIMLNMTIEVEGKGATYWNDDEEEASNNSTKIPEVTRGPTTSFREYVKHIL